MYLQKSRFICKVLKAHEVKEYDSLVSSVISSTNLAVDYEFNVS
jgi:hypothetical protein